MSSRLFHRWAIAVLALLSLAPISQAASLLRLHHPRSDDRILLGGQVHLRIGNETSSMYGLASREINVDGRSIAVAVNIMNTPSANGESGVSPTRVNVFLCANDGASLPQITAVRVKFERVKPPARFYRSSLRQDTTQTNPSRATYAADTTSFKSGALVKATVILTTLHETRIVNIGELRVAGADIPLYPINHEIPLP